MPKPYKPPDALGIDIRGTLDQEDLARLMDTVRQINRKRPTEFYGLTIIGGSELIAEQAIKQVGELTGEEPIFVPAKRTEH